MSKNMKKLPKDINWQREYKWDDESKKLIRARIRYDCGSEYTMILTRTGRTEGFDESDTLWCEEHDPTMPWVEDYDYENGVWKEV